MDPQFFDRLSALNERKTALDKEYDLIRDDARKTARDLVQTFHFTAADLGLPTEAGAAPVEKHRVAPKPKYQNPTGPETWTGRGRMPVWFAKAVEAGAKAEDMLIQSQPLPEPKPQPQAQPAV